MKPQRIVYKMDWKANGLSRIINTKQPKRPKLTSVVTVLASTIVTSLVCVGSEQLRYRTLTCKRRHRCRPLKEDRHESAQRSHVASVRHHWRLRRHGGVVCLQAQRGCSLPTAQVSSAYSAGCRLITARVSSAYSAGCRLPTARLSSAYRHSAGVVCLQRGCRLPTARLSSAYRHSAGIVCLQRGMSSAYSAGVVCLQRGMSSAYSAGVVADARTANWPRVGRTIVGGARASERARAATGAIVQQTTCWCHVTY